MTNLLTTENAKHVHVQRYVKGLSVDSFCIKQKKKNIENQRREKNHF